MGVENSVAAPQRVKPIATLGPRVPLLSTCPTEWTTGPQARVSVCVHSSSSHNSQEAETSRMCSGDEWIDKDAETPTQWSIIQPEKAATSGPGLQHGRTLRTQCQVKEGRHEGKIP